MFGATVAGLCLSASAAAACWPPAPSGWISAPIEPKDQFVVQGPKVYQAELDDAAKELRNQSVFGYYEQHLGITRLGFPGQTGLERIYLDPTLPDVVPEADGLHTDLCGSPGTDLVVIDPAVTVNKDTFHATLAHELFHAAQAQVAGHFTDNWWYEATATWAETRFGYQDARNYSTTVTDHPSTPIDVFKQPVEGAKLHEYGAWTFVAWLFSRHKIGWQSMRQSFVDSAQSNATSVLKEILVGAATELGDQLASFWADHTDVKPQFGPTAKMTTVNAPVGTDTHELPVADPLAARILRIHPSAGVRQLVVIVHKLGPGQEAWIRTGPGQFWRIEAHDSFNETFCRGGSISGSLPLPDTDDVRVAITSVNDKATGNVELKLIGSTDPCPKPLELQPGLAIGSLHLGMTPAEANSVTIKHHYFNSVPTPFGVLQPAAFNLDHALAIVHFIDGRIALIFVGGNRARTKSGITGLVFHNLNDEKPQDGPLFIPGSTLAEFGEQHCAPLHSASAPAKYCWHEGPRTRYTLATGELADPCPNDPDHSDGDVDFPPCTYPKDFYVGGLAVATHRGAELAKLLLAKGGGL